MNNNDDLLKNYIESQKRQKEILEETKKSRLKNENFGDQAKNFYMIPRMNQKMIVKLFSIA